ncbi:2-phospho-L-lactate guanylyltransferase [Halobacteriales archaeon QS_1_69_70]|nr:MAG: 2-phospho-L-lactate guanylyltransferase [Halobacteriales archaeon QS_1_69_70]
MEVLVPFAGREPKTRLADCLRPDERAAFARAMCLDVCAAVADAGHEPTVLSTAPIDVDWPVVVDERPLTEAVNAALVPPTAVVMADLALLTPAAVRRLVGTDGEVVLAPGLGGGTNAAVVRHDEFRFDYHGASVRDHRDRARAVDAALATVDSFRLAVDVDEARDLVEVLLHGTGRAKRWLTDAGFAVETTEGRVVARR